MKYTALITILMGIVVACFSGFRYASVGPPDRVENPLVFGLVLPMVFAVALVIAGAALWFVSGRGYTARVPNPAAVADKR
jgi:hypothetical protein